MVHSRLKKRITRAASVSWRSYTLKPKVPRLKVEIVMLALIHKKPESMMPECERSSSGTRSTP